MAAFREVVADFELVFPPAKLACGARGEVIRKREENLGAEGLQERAPGIAWQGGLERTDALRGDDRDALRLARETEEFLVSRGIVFAYGCEVLVLIAEEENLPEMPLRVRFDFGNRG